MKDSLKVLKVLYEELDYALYCMEHSEACGPTPYQQEVAQHYGFTLPNGEEPPYNCEETKRLLRHCGNMINIYEEKESIK